MHLMSTGREKLKKEKDREEKYKCNSKTAILSKAITVCPVHRTEIIGTIPVLYPLLVPELCSPHWKCLSGCSLFLLYCLFIPPPHAWKIATDLSFGFLSLLLPGQHHGSAAFSFSFSSSVTSMALCAYQTMDTNL